MKIIFKETQQFRQKWIWALLIGLFIFTIASSIYPLFQDPSAEEFKELIIANIISFAIFLLTLLLFYFMKLETKISTKGIEIRFFPFSKKNVSWHEIEKTELVDYGFVGGWGVRLWTPYGTVYNISGSKGLHIKLKSGKQFLIGTQKNEELEKLLNDFQQ